MNAAVAIDILAQVKITERDSEHLTCVQQNGICPSWIVGHLDDYLSPLWKHIELALASVVIGFAIAFALALLAHRRRWLTGPIVGVTGILYTIPSLALFAILIPLTGFGFTTALIPLTSYTLLILFRNIIAGLDNVPDEATRRRARDGLHRPPAAVEGRAAARAARDLRRAARRDDDQRRARRARLLRGRRRPRPADPERHRVQVQRVGRRRACACCWRSCSTSGCWASSGSCSPGSGRRRPHEGRHQLPAALARVGRRRHRRSAAATCGRCCGRTCA